VSSHLPAVQRHRRVPCATKISPASDIRELTALLSWSIKVEILGYLAIFRRRPILLYAWS
jgi:hypothetical protein